MFTVLCWKQAGLSVPDLISIYSKGLIYDLAVALTISLPYAIYLLFISDKWNRSLVNRILTYFGFFVVLLLCMFSFFAEIAFWGEFDSRFNFIAVDYLVYTYEVVNNIKQSYSLPKLIGGMFLITVCIIIFCEIRKIFFHSFNNRTAFSERLKLSGTLILLSVLSVFFLKNSWAEDNDNKYKGELSKAGIFSFFAAFRSNELDYEQFYKTIDRNKLLTSIK
ncbi:MAG: LTA synthase family protein, partial [Chitinophagaceae bacterium]|nr:LTA synthase family protein [Chitinophagaceae bacterium]